MTFYKLSFEVTFESKLGSTYFDPFPRQWSNALRGILAFFDAENGLDLEVIRNLSMDLQTSSVTKLNVLGTKL